jgi:tRNA pseudouridine38-40 synthase
MSEFGPGSTTTLLSVKTWKITLEYDGSKYRGWQEQRNARTIMGELRQAAEDVFGGEVEIQGSGRTDAGVHASAQVAHLRAPSNRRLTPERIRAELNGRLPAEIAILSVEAAPSVFHARHDAITRTYVYQIATQKSAFSKKYVWWIKEPLNIDLMSRAARMLSGRHDFVCFRAADPSRPNESTIVIVESASIEAEENLIVFRIEASHFIWRMVRRLAGALVKLGKGEITIDDWQRLLDGKGDRRLDVAAWTAPSSGLFLEHVKYADRARH